MARFTECAQIGKQLADLVKTAPRPTTPTS
jgi:hypothetical protein